MSTVWVLLLFCGHHTTLAAFLLQPWTTNGPVRSHPFLPPTHSAPARAGFTLHPAHSTGITFSNHLSDLGAAYNQVRMNGSGVALGDFNLDGWCDVFLCGLESPARLYQNQGQWKFEDVTASSGLGLNLTNTTGALWADTDGDGDLDLLINGIGTGTRLFINDGKGTFLPSPPNGLITHSGAMSMATGDVDGDGDIDLYVTHYRTNTIRSTGYRMIVDGRGKVLPAYQDQYEVTSGGRLIEYGEPDTLYLNDGRGSFTAVSWTDGRFRDESGTPLQRPPRDWGLSVVLQDLDGNHTPDLYICNDFWSPDRIWLNNGQGQFQAAPPSMIRHTSNSSMGMDVADLDRDGRSDWIVVDMLAREHARRMRQRAGIGLTPNEPRRIQSRPQTERNTVFWNRGDGTFAEIAFYAHLHASEWSWSVGCLDVDLDGYEDVLITTGNLFDMLDEDNGRRIAAAGPKPLAERITAAPRLQTPLMAFRNNHDLTFEPAHDSWGFNQIGMAHGMAFADLDQDGDLDVVINALNAHALVYENSTTAPRIAVSLRGLPPNTYALGSKLELIGTQPSQSQSIQSGGRYLSCDQHLRTFAIPAPTGPSSNLRLKITWPNGSTDEVPHLQPQHRYDIQQTPPHSTPQPIAAQTHPIALLQNVSPKLNHNHSSPTLDEWSKWPTLSRSLLSLSPPATWFDLNGDGHEDLLVGDGATPTLSAFLSDGKGNFRRDSRTMPSSPPGHDLQSLTGWITPQGERVCLATSASENSDPIPQPLLLTPPGFTPPHPTIIPVTTAIPHSFAVADVNGDGWLDLFVGSRFLSGQYPQSAPSHLLLGGPQTWTLDSQNTTALAQVGLVQAASLTDIDSDSDPDLILACEWGPVRVLLNERGVLTDATESLGLSSITGWWNGVCLADLNNDGLQDIVASNWGQNTPYQPYMASGIGAVHGDLSKNGRWQFLECYRESPTGPWLPWRDRRTLLKSMPWIQEHFPTAESYATATLDQILGSPTSVQPQLTIRSLQTTVFLRKDRAYEPHPLPAEAQFSPAFGIAAPDLNGDGYLDVVLAQNFFGLEETQARLDGGRGLCLKGDGTGKFTPLRSTESGLVAEGEQRAVAVADFNEDGRPDLAITQHGGPTLLFQNQQTSNAQLRIRLLGTPGNPNALGATLRALTSPKPSPSIPVTSAVTLLPSTTPVQRLEVSFPWKKPIEVPIPQGRTEVEISADGTVRPTAHRE